VCVSVVLKYDKTSVARIKDESEGPAEVSEGIKKPTVNKISLIFSSIKLIISENNNKCQQFFCDNSP
jgi:hypothetical protein